MMLLVGNPNQEITHPIPKELGFCVALPDFLSWTETNYCARLARWGADSSAESHYPPSYRNNARFELDDPLLAIDFFTVLKKVPELLTQINSVWPGWEACGVNPKLRFCRYSKGQEFSIHQDGVYYPSEHYESKLSFILYLNSGEVSFEGGTTDFFQEGPGRTQPPVAASVQPKSGTLMLFDHKIWHAGAMVTRGEKYLLRSDIIFKWNPKLALNAPITGHDWSNGHRGYVWCIKRVPIEYPTESEPYVVTSGRDCYLRFWNKNGKLLQSLKLHSRSVLSFTFLDDFLISISRDSTIQVCNWKFMSPITETFIQSPQNRTALLSIDTLSEGRFAVGGADGLIYIWNHKFNLLHLCQHSGWVWDIKEMNQMLISISEEASICVWDMNTFKLIETLHAPHPCTALAVYPALSLFAVGDLKGHVSIWRLSPSAIGIPPVSCDLIGTFHHVHQTTIRTLSFLKGGKILISGGEDCFSNVYDTQQRKHIQQVKASNFVTDILIEENNTSFISCSYDGTVQRHPLLPIAFG